MISTSVTGRGDISPRRRRRVFPASDSVSPSGESSSSRTKMNSSVSAASSTLTSSMTSASPSPGGLGSALSLLSASSSAPRVAYRQKQNITSHCQLSDSAPDSVLSLGGALPARCYASTGTSHDPVSVCLSVCVCVCVSVCLSQVGVLSTRLNESSWLSARELPSTRPTLC